MSKPENKYPIVKGVRLIMLKHDVPLKYPSAPKKPEYKPISETKSIRNAESNSLIAIYIILGLVVFIGFVGSPVYIAYLAIPLFVSVLIYQRNNSILKGTETQNSINSYSNMLRSQAYEEKLAKYESTKTKTDKINNDPQLLKEANLKLRESYFKKIKHPFNYRHTKRGALEKSFEEYLRNFFFDHDMNTLEILNNRALKPEHYDESVQPYQPDICIYHKKRKCYFDIEIDEPYDLKTKAPIHFLEDNVHSDYIRDYFFVQDAKWVVIRIPEISIKNYSKQCAVFITNIICLVTKDSSVHRKIINIWKSDLEEKSYKDLCKTIGLKCWTYSESREMAKNNVREKYLNDH